MSTTMTLTVSRPEVIHLSDFKGSLDATGNYSTNSNARLLDGMATSNNRLDIESRPGTPPDEDQSEIPAGAVNVSDSKKIDRAMKMRVFATNFGIFLAGMHDAGLGPIIPYLKVHYNIGLGFVALVYLLTFAGWLTAGLTVVHLQAKVKMGGTFVIGAIFQLLGWSLMCWAPPYPIYVMSFGLVGLGVAYQDAMANTYNASLPRAHLFLGALHAVYGLGGLVAPILATAITSTNDKGDRWNYFYYVILFLGVFNVGFMVYNFYDDVSDVLLRIQFRVKGSKEALSLLSPEELSTREEERRAKSAKASKDLKAIFKRPEVILLCVFFFLYVGAEVTAGGWVVEFLIEVRHGKPQQMGYIASAFWGGLTLGRVLLAEPTNRFGIQNMVLAYAALALVVQLVFWFVPQIIISTIMISLLGFLIGPFYPAGISLASNMLPVELHAGAISIIAVCGNLGSATFPFLTGAIASAKGVQVLQPMLAGLLATMGVVWTFIPRRKQPLQL